MNYKVIANEILEEYASYYSEVDRDTLARKLEDISKETAREILTNLKPLLEGFVNADTGENLYVNKCKQFGVEIGEQNNG